MGGLFEGNTGPFKLAGYVEADFLGAGTTSNDNQSNSFMLRQRQIWGQAAMKTGFTVTGGQMWSLVTETTRARITGPRSCRTRIDAQYTVGFSWARQPALRIQQRFTARATEALTLAASLEQAQITNYSATNAPTNFFFNGAGQNGGLLTPSTELPPTTLRRTLL